MSAVETIRGARFPTRRWGSSLPCSVFGPVFQPRRTRNGQTDPQPYLASCSCGAFERSERHELVAQWADAHRAEAAA